MNHFVASAAIVSVVAFLVVIATWRTRVVGGPRRVLGIYWFSIGFWAFFVGTQPVTLHVLTPFWWGWFLHLGCTLIPVFLLHMAIILTRQTSVALYRGLWWSYLVGVLFNVLNLLTATFTHGTTFRDAYAYPKPAFLYPVYFIFFVTLVAVATVLMLRYRNTLSASERRAITILLWTQVAAYSGGMDNFFIMADLRIPLLYPYGLYLVLPYAAATFYALRSSRLFETTAVPRAQVVSV